MNCHFECSHPMIKLVWIYYNLLKPIGWLTKTVSCFWTRLWLHIRPKCIRGVIPFKSCSLGLANNVLKYGTWDSFLTLVKLVQTWSEERRVRVPPWIGTADFGEEDDVTIDSEGDLVLATQGFGFDLGWAWSELRRVRAAKGFSL